MSIATEMTLILGSLMGAAIASLILGEIALRYSATVWHRIRVRKGDE